jgi:HlyD family secretion protein
MKLFHFVIGMILLATGFGVGWFWPRDQAPAAKVDLSKGDVTQTKVVAQGRILPQSGLINVFAPPNQRIESILVSEGDQIEANAELATFSGQATLQLQAEMIDSQGDDARRELEQKILVAKGNVLAANNGVKAAKLQLAQIEAEDSLSNAEKQLENSREKLLQMQRLSNDPATRLYVSQTSLDDQQLSIESAESQLNLIKRKREDALTGAKLNLEVAEKTQSQAEAGLSLLRKLEQEQRTLRLSKSIAEKSAENAKLLAPIAATVLKVNGKRGEVMLQSPLLQLGDLSKLVCVAEVIDRLVPHVKKGQSVMVTSSALVKPLYGKVASVGRIVGTGILTDPNPLAVMDRRTVEVKIELDLTGEEIANQLINLQVTAEIDVEPKGPAEAK